MRFGKYVSPFPDSWRLEGLVGANLYWDYVGLPCVLPGWRDG